MLCVTGVYLRDITNMIFFNFALVCELCEHLLFFTLKKNVNNGFIKSKERGKKEEIKGGGVKYTKKKICCDVQYSTTLLIPYGKLKRKKLTGLLHSQDLILNCALNYTALALLVPVMWQIK